MIPTEDIHDLDDSSFDESFSKALRSHGYLFPEDEDELQQVKKLIASESLEIPKELCDPMKIIANGRIAITENVFPIMNTNVVENLAMAAREGKDVPKEILDQMKIDRKQSEDDNA